MRNSRPGLTVALLLAAAALCAAHDQASSAAYGAGLDLASVGREMLQVLPAPGPPVCIAVTNQPCKSAFVYAPTKFVCPKGTQTVVNADGTKTCYLPCPQGSVPYNNGSDYWCLFCPTGWTFTGQVLTSPQGTPKPQCIKCADGCTWNRRAEPAPGQCVQDCRAPAFPPTLTFPVGPPPPRYGLCCDRQCPSTNPVLISYNVNAGVAVCASRPVLGVPVKTTRVFMKCRARKKCDYKVNPDSAAKPRPTTSPVCPPKPPAVLTGSDPKTGDLICYGCDCKNSFPYFGPKGEVKCSDTVVPTPCPTGYRQCGPYCVVASLANLLGGFPFSPDKCYAAVTYFEKCGFPECPKEVTPPNPLK